MVICGVLELKLDNIQIFLVGHALFRDSAVVIGFSCAELH